MKEEKYYCDFCKKETHAYGACTIRIWAGQGLHLEDTYPEYKDSTRKYRESEEFLVCDECIGEKITRCHGDTAPFAIQNGFRKFLKKFSWIK